MGINESSSTVFLIDYGLAKRYRDTTTLVHISFRDHKKLTGTTRYASVNTHVGIEQSRRDDLECLAYTLIYLVKGQLPWQGIPARNKAEKYKLIQEKKSSIKPEELSSNYDIEFAKFLSYTKSLKFEEKPDYGYAKKLFRECYYRQKYDRGFEFDWIKQKINYSLPEDKDYTSSATNQAENDVRACQIDSNVANNLLSVPQLEIYEGQEYEYSIRSPSCSITSKQEGGGRRTSLAENFIEQSHAVIQDNLNSTQKKQNSGTTCEVKKSQFDDHLCNFSFRAINEDNSQFNGISLCKREKIK